MHDYGFSKSAGVHNALLSLVRGLGRIGTGGVARPPILGIWLLSRICDQANQLPQPNQRFSLILVLFYRGEDELVPNKDERCGAQVENARNKGIPWW